MVPRFSRFLLFTGAAALIVGACTRETPLQPVRANVVAQDSGGGPPPPNDNRDSARFIPSVPYFDSTDVSNATVEPGEPVSACHDTIGPPTRTVWYFFTPSTAGTTQLTARLFGPAPGILTVYFASADTLITVGCSSNLFGPVTFNADSGSGFFFQISDSAGAAGPTVFSLQQDTIVPPPPPPPPPPPSGNDNFADARSIPGVPYSDTADFTSATREAFEPAACAFQSRTVWYRFTPSQTQAVGFGVQAPFFDVVTVYQGTSLDNLSFVRCNFGGTGAFTAQAGQTYYFQVSSDFPGTAIFFVQPPPPPQANFGFFPQDPSVFDLVQFQDFSFDPGGVGIQSQQWDFGDGATATGPFPTHRYAADGDYVVRLTVTTFDGRSASTSRPLAVRTRDVAIIRFMVPTAASSGQTRSITVGVTSNLNPENVVVTLFKSVPGGYQQIGALVQLVPVRSANRTTSFDFSYTFSADDAALGKVTFRAVATIVNGRDALPADNEAIGSPTRVSR